MENALNLDTVKLAENKKEIVILDQTLLPNQCKYLNIGSAEVSDPGSDTSAEPV